MLVQCASVSPSRRAMVQMLAQRQDIYETACKKSFNLMPFHYSTLKVVEALPPAARTATASGVGVDLRGYESALVVLHHGDWTDGQHAFEIQDSTDDGATDPYAAVADDELVGASAVHSLPDPLRPPLREARSPGPAEPRDPTGHRSDRAATALFRGPWAIWRI
jgi:hypothetical protein